MSEAKAKYWGVVVALVAALFLLAGSGTAQDKAVAKLRFATGVRAPVYDMPQLAAEEKGFWKQNGLETQWLLVRGTNLAFQAILSGSADMGMSDVASFTMSATRGLPVVIVADLQTFDDWHIWIRGDSLIKEPRDLKGARIGTSKGGDAAYAYARLLVKSAGFAEKDVKFIRIGSMQERVAALKAGVIEGYVTATLSEMPLKVRGEIRSVISMHPYLPKEWPMHVLFAGQGFKGAKPQVVQRAVKAFLQAADFVQSNPAWTMEKLMSFSKYPEEAARETSRLLRYGRDGKINVQGLKNVQDFLLEYEIIPREKALPVERLYTKEFTE